VRRHLGDALHSLRGRRGVRIPPPAVGVGLVVLAALLVLTVGLALAFLLSLFT
jgi:hypothetical protein